MEVRSAWQGELELAEVSAWLDAVLEKYADLKPRGIKVSNSLHKKGIAGKYRGVPIAMSRELYPNDQVVVVFDDEN